LFLKDSLRLICGKSNASSASQRRLCLGKRLSELRLTLLRTGGPMLKRHTSISAVAVAAAATLGLAMPAEATEGYFSNGFGARQKALAGAGVADSRDATAGALNPAGLVHVGDEVDFAFSLFSPRRSVTGDDQFGLAPTGNYDSDDNWFFIPNMAWSTRAFQNRFFDVMSVSLVGNGGMNTTYPAFDRSCPNPMDPMGPPVAGSGVFCAGRASINLLQMFMSVSMAKQIAPGISVGVAPIFALQSFESRGLEAFMGSSNSPNELTGGVNDWTYGGGVRAGVEFAPRSNVRIGIAGTTPIWSKSFGEYRGLFANNGGFDIPASIQAGVAVDVSPQLTFMLDWRYIFYSQVDAIANPSTNIFNCPGFGGSDPSYCLGGSNGAGFGWDDINVIKFGMEYRARPGLTLRAGYSWNENPISSRDVHFNVLAPGVVQHHITAGMEYDLGGGYSLEMAAMYAPENSVSGSDLFNPNHRIDIDMYQFDITAGIKYKFGEDHTPLK
jgi:long-chain fatty acid transport protein